MPEDSETDQHGQTPVVEAEAERAPQAAATGATAAPASGPAPSQGGDKDDGIRGRSVRQYVGSLRATYASVCAKRERTGGEAFPENVTDRIEAILAKYAKPDVQWTSGETWDDAYQLELLMINVLDPERLDVELEAKLKEAKDMGVASGSQFEERRKAQGQAQVQAQAHALEQALALAQAQGQTQSQTDVKNRAKEEAEKQEKVRIDRDRAMLQRLTEDLQWFYNTRDQRRRYAKQAQWRASVTFLVAMLLFGVVMFNTFSFGPMIEQRAEESRQRELAQLTTRRLAAQVKMQAEAQTARMQAAEAERREIATLRNRRLTEQVKMLAEAAAARQQPAQADKVGQAETGAVRDSNALTALEAAKASTVEIQTMQGGGQ